jgi:HK97 family phage major capsid protein
MSEYVKRAIEARQVIWDQAKALLDAAATEGRDLSAEERAQYDAMNTDLDERKQFIDTEVAREKSNSEAEEAFRTFLERPVAEGRKVDGPEQTLNDKALEFFRGKGGRALELRSDRVYGSDEFRALSKLSAGAGLNTVKTSFYDRLVAHLIEVSGILQAGPTVLNTTSGENLQIPKTTSHGTAALVAEAGTIAASDPAFGQVTLGAYKYGKLISVSNELVNDTSVDLLGYLAMAAGRAVGNALGTDLIVGAGSTLPFGIVTNATLGVTGGAGVVGVFTADNLIDLFYSVIAPYRNSPSCGWLLRDATMASVRKLKDSQNRYLFEPSLVAGTPDTLFAKPIHTDPNVAATALSAKSVVFGDISQYFVRMVNGVRFERSDDFAFNQDLVTFRCLIRADGVLVDQTGAVKYFQGNAA